MLKTLDRYIIKTLLQATGIVTLILSGILFVFNLMAEFKDLGDGDYGFGQALLYVLLKLPQNLYQFFPMLMMIGAISALSLLASHRELIVMRTSGLSLWRLMRSIIFAAILLITISLVLGEGKVTVSLKFEAVAVLVVGDGVLHVRKFPAASRAGNRYDARQPITPKPCFANAGDLP